MADEVTYTAKRGGASSVVVSAGEDSFEFVSGESVPADKVPADVLAYVRDGVKGYNIEVGQPGTGADTGSGAEGRRGRSTGGGE